ncbi:LytTR family transcriptional regulator DNA-binding domain-containing protein [Nisaea acidiphila]|uniref:LytTR family transcriptional regulator DNA-binding domain-containing protein n=1 Tax=Nisaea acidiphila TaxID=1862145 RepID=A0A9J7B046_9PROT|nr:MHYT domain-containing protein [Nisaea acidiphila]UUX51860.1 LytTR family transcriptional regulator DNA-binding domain-containing protein [Nisaea acidiphila]
MIVSYDPLLVVASVAVAAMASFTGLRLLTGLRYVDGRTRKAQLAKAAMAIGGGIWSMHFVGMLALRLPVPVAYDLLFTLGSVLIAILITGAGLALMHMGVRSIAKTVAAGTLIGCGIVAMHYVGMQALQGSCIVEFSPLGFVLPTVIAILSSTCALALAYKKRTLVQLSLGAVVLGVTISSMHYSAMAFTAFSRVEMALPVEGPVLPDTYLALVVAVAAFLVCGLFLLSALPMEDPRPLREDPAPGPLPEATASVAGTVPAGERTAPEVRHVAAAPNGRIRIPYERNNTTFFLAPQEIRSIRADGHYTEIYDGAAHVFCPWSLSKLEGVLKGTPFLRTHRSFLLNMEHATGFERQKDKAFVLVAGQSREAVPVSRSHMGDVRKALGL